MHLFTTNRGKVYKRRVGLSTVTEHSLPSGVSQVLPAVRPDSALFQGKDALILVGQFNKNLIWFPSRQKLWKLGIEPPTAAPGLAAGAGTGLTGTAIGVYTFVEYAADGTIVHESDPSAPSGSAALTNDNRSWSSLATTHSNARVNYKHLYVSMDGSDFFFVAAVPLASATYTENVATGDLGEQVSELRGVPPYAKFVTIYKRRAWYSDGSDTVYFSEIDEPESVPVTNSIKTQDGRKITSIQGLTDQIIIGTRKSIQEVQGYSADDFQMRTVSSLVGIISHHACVVINDKLWLLGQDGYYRFGGGLQYLMPTLRKFFRDAYLADTENYENAIARVDLYTHVVKLLVPGATSFYYIGHYLPSEIEFGGSGRLPFWTFDRRTRVDETLGVLTSGALRDELYTGSCDGHVRKENVDADADDDGDDYQKRLTIAHRHQFMGDQGGDDSHARVFQYLHMFTKSEEVDWSPSVYVGDDDAYSAALPRWTPERGQPASLLQKGDRIAVARTSHTFKLDGCSGKGITVVAEADAPTGFEHRGYAVEFENTGGEQTRDEAAS